MIRASSLPRVMKCIGSTVLPTVNEESSVHASAGTAVHAVMERLLITRDVDHALAVAPEEYRARCEAIPMADILAMLPRTVPGCEVPMRYDALRDIAWEADATPEGEHEAHYSGTLDVAYCDAVCPTVIDWKSGARYVEHPRTNPQLRAYALMLARSCEASSVQAVIVRLPEGAPPTVLAHTFDAMELDAIAHELRDLVTVRVPGARLALADDTIGDLLTVGEHCGWCPARYSCPAQTTVVQALVPMAARIGELSPLELGTLYEQAAAVEKLAGKVRDHVKARVMAGERITLPDGRILRASTYTRDGYTVNASTVTQVRAVKE